MGGGLSRLQDLLLWLGELGAGPGACARARAAMAQAMSVLERSTLEAAMGPLEDPAPEASARRVRL